MGACLPKLSHANTQRVTPDVSYDNPLHAHAAPLNSPTVFHPCDEELLLRITTCLAQNGYHEEVGVMVQLNKRFWRDEQIWDAFKDVPGAGGRTRLMYAAWRGRRGLYAAKKGYPTRLEWLLARGARVNAAAPTDGMTAFLYASKGGNFWSTHALLSGGGDMHARTLSGFTALMLCCKPPLKQFGLVHYFLAFELLRMGANVNATANDGTTPLMCAIRNSSSLMTYLLVTVGAHVNAQNNKGESVLMQACASSTLVTLRFLFERGRGLEVHTASNDGTTALMEACRDARKVRLMVNRGAYINDADDRGFTALMQASYNGNAGAVSFLLERRAAARLTTLSGYDALTWCCSRRLLLLHKREDYSSDLFFNLARWKAQQPFVKICRLLVAQGVDVNSSGAPGRNALMYASTNGHLSIVRALIKLGANVNANDMGFTALMGACKEGHLKIAQLLIDRGADLNAAVDTRSSALMSACDGGHLDVVRLLLDRGANVNATNIDGLTALMATCQTGGVDIARLLLTRGANVNAATHNGFTALMQVSQLGFLVLARVLIGHGADINATNEDNGTALTIARENRHARIVLLLLKKGASDNLEAPALPLDAPP